MTFKRGFTVLKQARSSAVIHLPLDSVLTLKPEPQTGRQDHSHVTYGGLLFVTLGARDFPARFLVLVKFLFLTRSWFGLRPKSNPSAREKTSGTQGSSLKETGKILNLKVPITRVMTLWMPASIPPSIHKINILYNLMAESFFSSVRPKTPLLRSKNDVLLRGWGTA